MNIDFLVEISKLEIAILKIFVNLVWDIVEGIYISHIINYKIYLVKMIVETILFMEINY